MSLASFRKRKGQSRRCSIFLPIRQRAELPEIPLHTNGSENDIRCQVTKRKISGGTRSDRGRDCRDAFLGLAKTCSKLGITFWDYLGARLAIPNQPVVLPLPSLVRVRCTAV